MTFSKLAVTSSQIEPLHLVSIRRWYIGTITYYKVIYEKYSKFLKRLCYRYNTRVNKDSIRLKKKDKGLNPYNAINPTLSNKNLTKYIK